MQSNETLETVRCRNCDKKLARIRGSAEIKCVRCKEVNYYENQINRDQSPA